MVTGVLFAGVGTLLFATWLLTSRGKVGEIARAVGRR
jgi:hypothetical protein